MNPQVYEEGAGQPRAFATTRWSLILSAGHSENGEQKAHDALEELCRVYWRPVFVFVCRRGYSTEDAQDLTQDFFDEPAHLLHSAKELRIEPGTSNTGARLICCPALQGWCPVLQA